MIFSRPVIPTVSQQTLPRHLLRVRPGAGCFASLVHLVLCTVWLKPLLLRELRGVVGVQAAGLSAVFFLPRHDLSSSACYCTMETEFLW